MELGLSGRACLVTGSTGGGGRERGKLLVADGARVVTSGRGVAPGVGEAAHVQLGLSTPGAAQELLDQATAALGGLDVLVNNVGYAVQARFAEVTDEEWEHMWQLNVMSYVRANRA